MSNFLAMINDSKPTCAEICQYKYVDDMTLFMPFETIDQTNVMQNELDNLKQWSDNNLMWLNPTKCKFMTFCFQRAPVKPYFQIENLPINQSACIKHLGVHCQENLKWDNQIDFMCKSFNRKLYFLRQLKRCNIPVCDLRIVYIQYIRPVIECASPVWFSGLRNNSIVWRNCKRRLFV